jgi:hypothetical protein
LKQGGLVVVLDPDNDVFDWNVDQFDTETNDAYNGRPHGDGNFLGIV